MIDRDQNVIEKRFKYLGITTNNVAEYTAILLGIRRAIELGATSLEVRADSKLAIEQLSGNYKIKHPELKKIYLEIQGMLTEWKGNIIFTHIPREKNIEADRLSNVAMDQ
jgi:ribonuclease HI